MLIALTIYFWFIATVFALSLIVKPGEGSQPSAGGYVFGVLLALPGLHLELVAAHDLGIPAWVIWGGTLGAAVLGAIAVAREWPRGTPAVGGMILSLWLMWHGLQVMGR